MNKNNDKKNNKELLISAIVLIALILVLSGVAAYFKITSKNKDDKTLAYTDLIKVIY